MICTLAAALMTGAGCSGQEQPKVSAEPSRVLIAYYSWGGNTKYAAAQIQKATGGTLFEIKPVKPYPSEYRECTVQARKEIQEGGRPELAAKVEDMGKYDVIFIGSPNWWSTIAPPVASFLASYDLSGKTVDSTVNVKQGAEAVSQVHRSQGRRFCRGRNTDDEGRARQVGQ